jgi:hypothetical protein
VLRILAWGLALAASAGIGAFVAAHTNPLQPGLEEPSPLSSLGGTSIPSPEAAADRWSGTILTKSLHELHVGGACETDWRTRVSFRVDTDGRLAGRGEAVRWNSGEPCAFTTAERQIERFVLRVDGVRKGSDTFLLTLTETAHRPSSGAEDLGGYSGTVLGAPLSVTIADGRVADAVQLEVPDRRGGTYRSASSVRLACRSC